MAARHRGLRRPANFDVVRTGKIGVDAALHADFGGTSRGSLAHAPRDFREAEIIRPATQRVGGLAFGKSAEAAMIGADIRVVDIPRNDVADEAPVHLVAKLVDGTADSRKLGVARPE